MAGLDSFYQNDVNDSAEHGSYSSLSTPGGRLSMRQRRVVDPFNSTGHASLEDVNDMGQTAEYNRVQSLHQVSPKL